MSIKSFFESLFSFNHSVHRDQESQTTTWLGRKINRLKELSVEGVEFISNFFRNIFNFRTSTKEDKVEEKSQSFSPQISNDASPIPSSVLGKVFKVSEDKSEDKIEEKSQSLGVSPQGIDDSVLGKDFKVSDSRHSCKRFYNKLNEVLSFLTPEGKFKLIEGLVENRILLEKKFVEKLKNKALAEVEKELAGVEAQLAEIEKSLTTKKGLSEEEISRKINLQANKKFLENKRENNKVAYSDLPGLLFKEEFLQLLINNIEDLESLTRLTQTIKNQKTFSLEEKKLIIPTMLYKIKEQILKDNESLSSTIVLSYLVFFKEFALQDYRMNGDYFDSLSLRHVVDEEDDDVEEENVGEENVEELNSLHHDVGMSILHTLSIVKSLKNEPDLMEILYLIKEGNIQSSPLYYKRLLQQAWMLFIHKLDDSQIERSKEILIQISKQLESEPQLRTIISLRGFFSKGRYSADEYLKFLIGINELTEKINPTDLSYQTLKAAWRIFATENVLLMEEFNEHQKEGIDKVFDVLSDRFESSSREFLVRHAKAYKMLQEINKTEIDVVLNIDVYKKAYALIEEINDKHEFYPLISNRLDEIKAKQAKNEKILFGLRELKKYFDPFANKFKHDPLIIEGLEDLKTQVIGLVKGTPNENILSPKTEAERKTSIRDVCILTDCDPEEAEAIVNKVPER